MRTPMQLPPVAQTNSGRMNRHLNKIRDCLRTLHSYEPPPAKRSRGGSPPPLRLVVIAGATEKRVSVTEGLVNDVTPTLGGVDLIDNPTPPATAPETGDLTVGANYIWVKTVGTFADPDTYVVTIEKTTTTTPPTPPAITASGFTSCRILARVDMAAVTFARTITLHHAGGDLFVESFGSINYWWKV